MCRKMGSLAGTATIVMVNVWVALRLGVPESCRITTTIECVHSKGYKSIVQHWSLINCYRKSTWGIYIEVVRYDCTSDYPFNYRYECCTAIFAGPYLLVYRLLAMYVPTKFKVHVVLCNLLAYLLLI